MHGQKTSSNPASFAQCTQYRQEVHTVSTSLPYTHINICKITILGQLIWKTTYGTNYLCSSTYTI